jgi:hypothetical protein
MKELSKEEKEYIEILIKDYKEIHGQISSIESQIKSLSEKAYELVKDLESKRKEEKEFTEKISKKYGEGHLDVLSLTWQKKSIVDERKN